MTESIFQGRIVEDLTEMVERAEHRAVLRAETVRLSKLTEIAPLGPPITDEDSYLLGAA
jgi:hypothetical protein